MKKTIPAIEEFTCDFTGGPILTEQNYLGGTLNMDLMFHSKEAEKEIRNDFKLEGYSEEEINSAVQVDAYEVRPVELHFSEEIAIEFWKFLLRKYPEKMKKFKKDHWHEGWDVVPSGWPKPKRPKNKK